MVRPGALLKLSTSPSTRKLLSGLCLILMLIVTKYTGDFFSVKSAFSTLGQKKYLFFEFEFPWPAYHMKAPWHSAMAQGQGLQALIKAHQITHEQKYLDTAKKLLNSFFIEVKDGGVTYKTSKDGWWYEGYPRIGSKEPRVLNMMLFTLQGIHEYYAYTKDPDAKYLFDQGVVALKKDLPHYYAYNGTYSYYDLCCGNLSPEPYHINVVNSLSSLYYITNDRTFKLFYDKWVNYTVPSILLSIHHPPPHFIVDKSGIPIVDYGYVGETYIGLQRNPVTIIHYAFNYYNKINEDKNAKQYFLNNVNWLLNNAV